MPLFSAQQLTKIGTDIFVAAGVPFEEAKLVTKLLVKANLVGHDSHGILRIIQYLREIKEGMLKPGVNIEISHETESSALVNGNWGFGQVVANRSMNIAIEKARNHTIGVVGAFSCNHVGRLADYTMMAVENNMVGIAMVNSVKCVAPYGGVERVLSTNPISYAFPTEKEVPFVFDIATSVAAEGKLRYKLSRGEQIPEGWIINRNGEPSRDPADYYKGGALLPLGGDASGYKGFGLGLAVDVLTGILSKSGCAYEASKKGNGVFFEAINIESFMPIDEFKKQTYNLVKAVKSSRPRPDFKEIMIPGEPEFETERKRLREGIYVPEKTWEDLKNMAKDIGLSLVSSVTEQTNTAASSSAGTCIDQ